MIQRFMRHKNINMPYVGKPTFMDEKDIAWWSREAVDYVAGVGIIQGDDWGEMKPWNNTTRAEATMMLYRVWLGMKL